MFGQRQMIRNGYRWDVFAYFPCNAGGVRVAVRKTPEGAARFAASFARLNRVNTSTKMRHDPLLDEVMNTKKRRLPPRQQIELTLNGATL